LEGCGVIDWEREEKDVLRSEVLEGFSDEMIDLIRALQKEKESFGEMGIDLEEKSFYDILHSLAIKYDFDYPEDKLIALSKAVKKVVDDKAKYTDWNQRNDIKAELKVDLSTLPLRTPSGEIVELSQVADLVVEPSQIELHRDNMKQSISVTARLEGRDMGGAVRDILAKLRHDPELPPGSYEIGGLYLQQQQAFHNLLAVLVMAFVLVFTVLLFEFRNFAAPISIMLGAVLAMFGTIAALLITGISLNIVSFLGAIIGIGIVAKNGILMLDMVDHLIESGQTLTEALVHSGRRRLRPVLMTSLTTLLGMLPIAYGLGSGADMLRPLAVAVMGALTTSVLLSLIATPVFYHLLVSLRKIRPNV